MEIYDFMENKKDRLLALLQDYANNIIVVYIYLKSKGIENVHNLFKEGYKIIPVEEHIKNLSEADKTNPYFAKKAKRLNEIADQLNLIGENIDEVTLKEILSEVKEIVRK